MSRTETLDTLKPRRQRRWLFAAVFGALAVLVVFSGLALFAQDAQQQPIPQDAGTLDKDKAGEAFKKRPYSPYADRKFPDAPVLRRHAPAHRVLDGCRRVRLPPDSARRVSFRARRADHGLERPAREALAPARFPRRRGSLGQHGLLPRSLRGQARTARRSDGPQVV